jgi:hypothetical protein
MELERARVDLLSGAVPHLLADHQPLALLVKQGGVAVMGRPGVRLRGLAPRRQRAAGSSHEARRLTDIRGLGGPRHNMGLLALGLSGLGCLALPRATSGSSESEDGL